MTAFLARHCLELYVFTVGVVAPLVAVTVLEVREGRQRRRAAARRVNVRQSNVSVRPPAAAR